MATKVKMRLPNGDTKTAQMAEPAPPPLPPRDPPKPPEAVRVLFARKLHEKIFRDWPTFPLGEPIDVHELDAPTYHKLYELYPLPSSAPPAYRAYKKGSHQPPRRTTWGVYDG